MRAFQYFKLGSDPAFIRFLFSPLSIFLVIMERPKIVCLCGSTRFIDESIRQNAIETLKGHIVLTVGFFWHQISDNHYSDLLEMLTPENKVKLDKLHFEKIRLADEVLVINVNSYIGESTRNEIHYAAELNKPIRYLVPIQ